MTGKLNRFISIIAVCFISLFLLGLLNRSGSLILLWKEEPLGSISHDSGYGYYAFISDENISKLKLPYFLKEDGSVLPNRPLSVNEDLNATIKEIGEGSYRILGNNDLYFSATDGHPETHDYSILSPLIIRNRWLLLLFLCAVPCMGTALFSGWKYKNWNIFKTIAGFETGLFFLLLLFPWDKMTFPDFRFSAGNFLIKPLVQRNILFIILFAVIALISHIFSGKYRFITILAVIAVFINTLYYFIPEWNYYGQRADSAAYLEHYSASSIRTPGYPVFIETVYKIQGNSGLQELRNAGNSFQDENLQDSRATDSLGLINVARGQKIVLAAVFLTPFMVYCHYFSSVWFAIAAQLILCGGFLGVDNSYIMTECLSQAVLLLIAAVFIITMKEKRSISFLLMCFLSGIAMLIRPANIFLVIPFGISAVMLLNARKNFLILILGAVCFSALTAIPAVTIYREYKTFVWMPTSGYVEIARAIELMEPGDENAFDDPELKAFCRTILEKKELRGEADQNSYMWDFGVETAQEFGYDLISCSTIFGKVSRKIFLLHSREFINTLADTMKTALERTRLQIGPVPFAAITVLFIVLFFVNINTDSLTGLVLMLMHIAHLCVFIVNQPERRYIYSTEILCLLGWLLITISIGEKIYRLKQ